MFSRIAFKTQAKEKLKGNWAYLAGLSVRIVIITVFANAVSYIPYLTIFALLLVAIPLPLSKLIIAIKLYNGEDIPVSTIFSAYHFFGKVIGLSLWTALWVFLWLLLFIIPGIVKSISYSMAFYCLFNNPKLTIREALQESTRITSGYKLELLVLDLSWIGWALVSVVTLGLGIFFLLPYMTMTDYIAFRFLKKQMVL